MDILWMVVGGILMVAGLIGCVIPFIPGPPLCYAALLAQQLRETTPFQSAFLWTWAGITVLVVVLEYVVPLYGTRKYGGSKYGIWGCTIGLIVGFWAGPLGIILGPFVGALIGEMIGNADSRTAIRAAFGSFVGFLFGTLLKLVTCAIMLYYLIQSYF